MSTRNEIQAEINELIKERDEALAKAADAGERCVGAMEALARYEANQEMLDQCKVCADQLAQLRNTFVQAGFSHDEAFKIVFKMLPGDQVRVCKPTGSSLLEALLR